MRQPLFVCAKLYSDMESQKYNVKIIYLPADSRLIKRNCKKFKNILTNQIKCSIMDFVTLSLNNSAHYKKGECEWI